MMFPFLCPAGHPIQADREHAGEPSRCPICRVLFVIPAPSEGAAPPRSQPLVLSERAESSPAPPDPISPLEQPQTFHIPCPNGHELATASAMLGQAAICPECGAAFTLDKERSREALEANERAREAREGRVARTWLNGTLAIVAVVTLGVTTLIVLSIYNR